MSKKSPGAGATRDDIEISQQNAEADIPSRDLPSGTTVHPRS